jgi:hypothetical protein
MKIKSLVLGTLLGGLTALVWSNISWELIGWHEKSLRTFENDQEVAAVISSHTIEDGTYLMPYGNSKEAQERMRRGPIVFAAVRRGGIGSVARLFAVQIAILFAAAFLLTWLLLQTSGLTYGRRVLFLAVVGTHRLRDRRPAQLELVGLFGSFTAVDVADNVLTCLFSRTGDRQSREVTTDVAQTFSLQRRELFSARRVEKSRGRSLLGASPAAETKNAGRSARPRGHPSD